MIQKEKLDILNKKILEESLTNFDDKKVIFGEGNITSKLFLIGEAPGGDEEKLGRPFVGKAGKNLMAFLDTIGLSREDLYITNVVKIRPTKLSSKTGKAVNRPPDLKEKENFSEFLYEEIKIISPKLIVTLGNVPLQAVLEDRSAQIGSFHGREILFKGNRIFPLYHPAAIIYNTKLKEVYDEDILELRRYLSIQGENKYDK